MHHGMKYQEWFHTSPPSIRREDYRFYLFLNYAYIFALLGHITFLIPLYTMLGNPIAFWSDTVCLLSDVICFVLLRKGRMHASFIWFLCAISVHTTLSTLTFGSTTSLPLYFYTLLVLVFFSPWPLKGKGVTAALLIGLAIALTCYTLYYPPSPPLTHAQIIFWNFSNILANSFALSYGVYYFSFIVDTAEQDLRYQAEHDLLTGILNRNAIFQVLNASLRHVKTQKQALSVILGDIDHFKQVNDSYGHLVGDEVLMGVAHRLATALREGDVIGRFGGEEFVIVLPNCPAKDALRIAERMRASLVATRLTTSAGGLEVSMSFGVTNTGVAESSDRLLARVDEALYRAKNSGRNRVEYA